MTMHILCRFACVWIAVVCGLVIVWEVWKLERHHWKRDKDGNPPAKW